MAEALSLIINVVAGGHREATTWAAVWSVPLLELKAQRTFRFSADRAFSSSVSECGSRASYDRAGGAGKSQDNAWGMICSGAESRNKQCCSADTVLSNGRSRQVACPAR